MVLMQTANFEGFVCASCNDLYFKDMTSHTAVLGWWGMLSFFITPVFLVMNLVCWLRTRRAYPKPAADDGSLESRRPYAELLLDERDEAAVTAQLVTETGRPEAEVSAWVAKLAQTRGHR